MPIIQGSTSIAANAVNSNVLSGSQFEFLPYNAFVEFGLTAAATGMELDVSSGTDILAQRFLPSENARIPVYPDDFTLNDVAVAGDRLVIQARNTTGAAIILRHSVRITPV